MKLSLKHVQATYRLWGTHPFFYKLACIITFLGRENKLRRIAAEKLYLRKGDTVLDLACGTGLNFSYLEKYIGNTGKIIAFDYSEEMLCSARKNAAEHGWKNIEFLLGDAAELHLKNKVDGVESTLGISAIPRYKEALQKAVNALADGGRISILDASLPSGLWKIFNPLIAWIYKNFASWDYTKDIRGVLKSILPRVSVEEFNGGTIYIIHATK
ncbi:methyltransferase domain-containing protein [Candidatus Peregrinibacteria bacterium]|nr:methyltransferase domain-containing protein [Candidatus Peregrinibacteria bacterium]